MKFIPKLFNTEMVIALLNDTKNQTRRVIKKKYSNTDIDWKTDKYGTRLVERQNDVPPPKVIKSEKGKTSTIRHITLFAEIKHPYKKGDVIWVRETFTEAYSIEGDFVNYIYKADGTIPVEKWKPSLFMPKQACRLFLEVTEVTVERLNDVSETDAVNEGVLFDVALPIADFKTRTLYRDYTNKTAGCADARSSYMTLWQKINGKQSWNENPWVWVIKFKKIDKPTNFL